MILAIVITVTALGVWGWVVYKIYYEEKKSDAIVLAALGLGGVVVGGILFFVLWIVLLIAFFPGDTLFTPAGNDPAYAKVKSGHEGLKMGHYIVGALVAYALYKHCSRKRAAEEEKKSTTPEEHHAFEIVNTLA